MQLVQPYALGNFRVIFIYFCYSCISDSPIQYGSLLSVNGRTTSLSFFAKSDRSSYSVSNCKSISLSHMRMSNCIVYVFLCFCFFIYIYIYYKMHLSELRDGKSYQIKEFVGTSHLVGRPGQEVSFLCCLQISLVYSLKPEVLPFKIGIPCHKIKVEPLLGTLRSRAGLEQIFKKKENAIEGEDLIML